MSWFHAVPSQKSIWQLIVSSDRGRGISVHRSDCRKAFEFDQLRKVDVGWNVESADSGQERIVSIRVISLQDMPGLLKSMSEAFSTKEINIHNAQGANDQRS